MKTYTTAPDITTAEALRLMAQSINVITANAARAARRGTLTAWHWLNESHDMSNEEGRIILTGWQYVGIACAVCIAALLVSAAG